eukprot:scaffold10930_cov19-Prasinocladus_malaysianus.AAC.1
MAMWDTAKKLRLTRPCSNFKTVLAYHDADVGDNIISSYYIIIICGAYKTMGPIIMMQRYRNSVKDTTISIEYPILQPRRS